jgi:hypothetical protein
MYRAVSSLDGYRLAQASLCIEMQIEGPGASSRRNGGNCTAQISLAIEKGAFLGHYVSGWTGCPTRLDRDITLTKEDETAGSPCSLVSIRKAYALSYKVMWFEDDPPASYPRLSVGLHDFTDSSVWTGGDARIQRTRDIARYGAVEPHETMHATNQWAG